MALFTTNTELLKKFGKYSIFTGISLIIVGVTGVVVPNMMSLETSIFIAFFMLLGGFFWVDIHFNMREAQ